MALKFGRGIRTVKTEDPITGARIKDPQVYGKKTEYGTVSSWPEVREMYKAGKLKGTFEGRKTNPAIMEYLSGNIDILSDKEFDEPILGISGNEKGQFTSLISNFKPGGKQYTALSKKQAGYGLPKLGTGQAYGFDTGNTIADYTSARGGAGASIGTDLETFRKKAEEAPVVIPPVVEKPVVKTPDPTPPVDNTDDGVRMTPLKPTKVDAKTNPKLRQAKPPVVVEKEAFVTPEKNYKLPKKVSMNPFAKGATSQGSTKRYLGQVAESVGSRVKNVLKGNVNKGYMKEQKLFYDTYGGGETIGKEGFGDMSLDEVRGLKKKIKADPALSKSDFKEGKKDLNSAIRLKKLESKDKVNFWTEAKGKEYRNSADYETSRSAYRSQTDNPANSNTITNQQAKLGVASADAAPTSYYATRGQMKDEFAKNNPTASKQEIRQGVRGQIKTNRQTQIDLRKKEQESGMY